MNISFLPIKPILNLVKFFILINLNLIFSIYTPYPVLIANEPINIFRHTEVHMPETIINVANAAELLAALGTATGGETILLAPGDYGDFDLSLRSFASTVTIMSADPANMAVFNTIDFATVTNLTIDQVIIDYTPDESTVSWTNAFEVTDSSHVVLSNSTIVGGLAITGSLPDVDPSDLDPSGNIIGLPAGRAVGVLRSDNVSIINNHISDFHKGIMVADSDFININFNEIADLRTTPLNGGNIDNLHIEGNHFHDSNPWNLGGSGDHGDYIHIWTVPTQDAPTQNLTIIDNFLQQGEGVALLGIYLEDEPQNIGFENVVIDGNVIHNGDSQSIRVEGADGLIITNNTLLQSSGGINDAPGMNIEPTNLNVLIENNITAFINIEVADPTLANIITNNNYFVQGTDPEGPNYSGDLFIDALNPSATLNDLMARPDSELNGSNYGAPATQFTVEETETINVIDISNLNTVLEQSFSARQFTSLEESDLINSTITWDYGDGTTGEGLNSTHTYDQGGNYVITLSITQNGETITDTKVHEVNEMVLADFSFDDSALTNQANTAYNTAWTGNESYAANGEGSAAQFNNDGSYITISSDPSLAGMDELSFQFDIQVTQDNGDEIRPLWSHGSYGIRIIGDTLHTYLWTSDGQTIDVSALNSNIRDGNAHTVTVVFDGASGTLTTLVDGVQVSYQDQITGTVAEIPHDVWLGGTIWGQSFVGTIDNVVILADSNILSDGHSYRVPPVPIATTTDTTTTEPVLDTTTFVEPVVTTDTAEPVVTTTYTNSSITTTTTQDVPIATATATDTTTTTTEPTLDTTTFVEPVVTTDTSEPVVTTTYTNSSITTATTEDVSIATTSSSDTTPYVEPVFDYETNMFLSIAGGSDAADYTAVGNAVIGSDALIFKGKGYVDLGQDADLFGLDAFTLSFDMSASTGKNDNKGVVRLAWNKEQYSIEMDGEDAIFRIQTDTGDTPVLTAPGVNLNDGASHNIVMSYDSALGVLSGYVDDALVAEVSGITGSIAEASGSGATIGGGGRGRNFKGEIDNFTMWSDADHTPDATYSSADLAIVDTSTDTNTTTIVESADPSLATVTASTTDEGIYDPDDYYNSSIDGNPLV